MLQVEKNVKSTIFSRFLLSKKKRTPNLPNNLYLQKRFWNVFCKRSRGDTLCGSGCVRLDKRRKKTLTRYYFIG